MSEANEKADAPEELEFEERELHRECSERGDVDLAGMAEIGDARTGPLFISSASTWKSNWSSSESFPMSCCAKVLVELTAGTKVDTAALEVGSAVQTLYTIF